MKKAFITAVTLMFSQLCFAGNSIDLLKNNLEKMQQGSGTHNGQQTLNYVGPDMKQMASVSHESSRYPIHILLV